MGGLLGRQFIYSALLEMINTKSINNYVDELRSGLPQAFRSTAAALNEAAGRQKALYDKKARLVKFQIGDSVFIQRVDPV